MIGNPASTLVQLEDEPKYIYEAPKREIVFVKANNKERVHKYDKILDSLIDLMHKGENA